MRNIKFIIEKEFLQIRRNRQMLPIIFFMPLFQLLVLVYAATFEIKIVNMHLIDLDKTSSSRLLSEKFSATNRFYIVNSSESDRLAKQDLSGNKVRMILKIPKDFEKDLISGKKPKLQIILNAEDGAAAAIIQGYSTAIITDFNINILSECFESTDAMKPSIQVRERYWYNPTLEYKHYMVSGILCILVTIIGLFLSGMNIVKEKESGTIEQLNVTPIKKHEFIIGKLLPFWLIALVELAIGLTLAKLLFDMPIIGSIILVFTMAALYLLVMLSLGLLISTISDTQQQAMFISWFILVLFMLMSGLFTPINSMPDWAQTVTLFNPIAHFIEIMRRILMKGAGFADIISQFFALMIYALAMISLAVWRYRKVTS